MALPPEHNVWEAPFDLELFWFPCYVFCQCGPCRQGLRDGLWLPTGRTISKYARRNLGLARSEGLNLGEVKLHVYAKHGI